MIGKKQRSPTMNLAEVAEFARNFAVMVRTSGPDPRALKIQNHAFHRYDNGNTMLSASGMLVPNSLRTPSSLEKKNMALVATLASVIDPFLTQDYKEKPEEAVLGLIGGAQIEVMVEKKAGKGAPPWIPSQLIALVEVSAASNAFQSLTGAPDVSPGFLQWEIGWSLNSLVPDPKQDGHNGHLLIENDKQFERNISSNHSHMARPTIRIAFLGVPSLNSEDVPDISASPPKKRGDLLLAVGSPFGILSPVHFLNSVSVGFVSNCYPSSASDDSLLMSDVHCLPGMEGGPVFSEHSRLIGILGRPLRQKSGGVEIQMVIPWEVIATARSDLLQTGGQKTKKLVCGKENIHKPRLEWFSQHPGSVEPFKIGNQNQDFQDLSPLQLEKATSSVVLLSMDDGSWASGVLLNKQGLVLTNAHLLEPWRFRNTSFKSRGETTLNSTFVTSFKTDSTMLDTNNGHTGIRARLDHLSTPIWCNATIKYVSKGPLDVALLQLKYVPDNLRPIIPDYTCPTPGSMAYVIGHALFGPRSGIPPSVWSGVVSRVVPIEKGPKHIQQRYLPAMLETTAAVHPGASGGAVVNSDGHMIGLVTSNTKHGGGTLIPHLNFSIPCAVLSPIFKFSEDMQNQSLLDILDEQNQQLSSIWALKSPETSPPLPHQPQLLSDKENKEVKGSRFTKFIAERQGDVFPYSNELPKVEKSMHKVLSSKL